MMAWHSAAALACPFLICWCLTAMMRRWAPRLGLVDHPDPRKVHTQPRPKGGGLAIFAAVVTSTCLLAPFGIVDSLSPWVLATGFGIVLVGLIDDLHPLPWQFRLGVQIAATAILLQGTRETGSAWWPFALLWIVGLTNAFNMLDNMDALSAGVGWIACGLLALAPLCQPGSSGNQHPALAFLMMQGALTGFLWFNWPPAGIFMGDAGSTFLGFFVGAYSLHSVGHGGFPWAWAVPLCVLAVPWYDLVSVVALRLWQGKSPFHADKQHLSHRLVAGGLSSPAAVRVIYVLALASGAGGLLLYQVPEKAWVIGCVLAAAWAALGVLELVSRSRR